MTAAAPAPAGSLRYVAYLRTSTDDQQSPADSRRWQLQRIEGLVAGHGTIVEVVHDAGFSRALPWALRPEAVALIERAALPAGLRGFDAIAIAEPARAFGDAAQATDILRQLQHWGVACWVPEVGGAVDLDNESHGILLGVFGNMSESERRRIGIRVSNAGRAHAKSGERFWMGARAPYGYRLVSTDTPHPKPARAREGVRLKRLEVEPAEAAVVREIFERYAAGHGTRKICAWLDAENVPTPLTRRAIDTDRAMAGSWATSTVQGILRNPAYTGFLVWACKQGRQRLRDVTNTSLGFRKGYAANPEDEWVWSPAVTHEAVVDSELWNRVQARRRGGHVDWHTRRARGPQANSPYPHALRGIVVCKQCGNTLEGNWQRGSAYVRCRLSALKATLPSCADHPRVAYLREDRVLPGLVPLLERLLTDPAYTEATVRAMTEAAAASPATDARTAAAQRQITEGNARIDSYRATLDSGGDPTIIGQWITDTARAVRAAEAELAALGRTERPVDPDAVRRLVARTGPALGRRLAKLPTDKLHRFLTEYGVQIEWWPRSDEATLMWDVEDALVSGAARAGSAARRAASRRSRSAKIGLVCHPPGGAIRPPVGRDTTIRRRRSPRPGSRSRSRCRSTRSAACRSRVGSSHGRRERRCRASNSARTGFPSPRRER
jgi:DNA invertase Pin-like site-specific DNA recombinase